MRKSVISIRDWLLTFLWSLIACFAISIAVAFAFEIPDRPIYSSVIAINSGLGVLDLTASAEFCYLHDKPLNKVKVPIIYGIPADPFPDKATFAKNFPYGYPFVLGGCCLGAQKEALVSQCTTCCDRRDSWSAKIVSFPIRDPFMNPNENSYSAPIPPIANLTIEPIVVETFPEEYLLDLPLSSLPLVGSASAFPEGATTKPAGD